jgi:endonuclease YncB( thermonuclease family)
MKFWIATLISLLTFACVPAKDAVLTGKVIRIVDAETIQVLLSSGGVTVRLYGIDAPEKDQYMGEEAIYGLITAVGGKGTDVTLKVMEQKDSQGRLVAIVSRDGLSVNEQLVADGYAWVARKELKPRVAMALCIEEAQARYAKSGLWASPKEFIIPPWEWRNGMRRSDETDYSRGGINECMDGPYIGRPIRT